MIYLSSSRNDKMDLIWVWNWRYKFESGCWDLRRPMNNAPYLLGSEPTEKSILGIKMSTFLSVKLDCRIQLWSVDKTRLFNLLPEFNLLIPTAGLPIAETEPGTIRLCHIGEKTEWLLQGTRIQKERDEKGTQAICKSLLLGKGLSVSSGNK